MNKIFLICTNSKTINIFFLKHISKIIEKNECIILTKITEDIKLDHKRIKLIDIKFSRKINLLNDLKCLFKVMYLKYLFQPKMIISITPKAGLISSVTSILSFKLKHIHYFTGQYWANYFGLKKLFFKLLDQFILFFSKKCLIDSLSQSKYLSENLYFSKKKLTVLGSGSIKGININKFYPNLKFQSELKSKLNIVSDSKVILFVGRINKDKGIITLSYAIMRLIKKGYDLTFLIIGDKEDETIDFVRKIFLSANKKLLILNFQDDIEKYYNLAFITCLPSHREGFGMSLLESSACGTPVIGSDIYGLRDTVINNYNGLLFPYGDIFSLSTKIEYLIKNQVKYDYFKKNGIFRVKSLFLEDKVINNFNNFLEDQL